MTVLMKNIFFILSIIVFFATSSIAQINSKWVDHLSYAETSDVSILGSKIITASEFGVFIYDTEENSLSKFSKINGLLGEKIFSLSALENTKAFVVGFETGDFDIVFNNGRIIHVNDIKNSSILTTKSINTIIEYNDKIFIGTPFGIVEYNIANEEFGDTFYFGDNGSYIYVNDIVILDNIIYAATNQGVYVADANDPFLVDYKRWALQTSIPVDKYNSIAKINGKIIANNSETVTKQYVFENSNWILHHNYSNVRKIKSNNEFLTYSAGNRVYVFGQDLILKEQIATNSEYNFSANSAIKKGNTTWIASDNIGLIKHEETILEKILPDGPSKNYSFRIKADAKRLYVMYGYYNNIYTPKGRRMGYEIFNTKEWKYINYTNFSNVRDLVHISIDPNDVDHIYMSSWSDGVVEMQNNEEVEVWNNTNSTIQKLHYAPNPNYTSIRIGGSVFDNDGNLWIANGWSVENPFVVRKANEEWLSFSMGNVASVDNGMQGICIDKNGNKWIGTRERGIWIYNEGESLEATGDDKKIKFSTGENNGNLPSNRVNTIAVDKDNEIWIGTNFGLVKFNDVDNMFESSSINANPIIINQDGVGRKLLGDQIINKIVVDGANNKWFATESGGAYYTSSNGQKTIYHFTKENSPIFSNKILDLDIDPETGRVFFVTPKGLLSFLGNATEGGESFKEVFAYPNPVRPEYEGDIYIKGLTDNTNVKITDINGNVIYETVSEGGQAVWNGRSFSGYKASSGVYLVFAISKDGEETTITKILIVN